MSTISGTSDNGAYMQSLQNHYLEADDDLETEKKRLREKTREQIDAIDQKSRENLERLREKSENSLLEAKETAQEESRLQRDRLLAEVSEARAKLYDKQGRTQNPEVATYKKLLEDSHKEAQITKERTDSQMENLETYFNDRAQEAAQKSSDKLSAALTESSRRANETIERVSQEQKSYSADAIEKHRKTVERMAMERVQENDFNERFVRKSIDEGNQIAEARIKKADDYAEIVMRDANRSRHDDAESVAATLRNQHTQETDKLRQDLSDLVESEKQYSKDRAQATQDAIKDFEPVYRARESSLQSGYQAQLQKAKQDANDHETRLAREKLQDMRQKDSYFTGLISSQTENSRLREQELQQTFQRDRSLLEKMAKDERERSNERTAGIVRDLSGQREASLNQQAKAYQETIARYRQQSDEQIRSLEGELARKSAPGDKTLISPAAEEELRKRMHADFEVKLSAEQQRGTAREESLRQTSQEKLNAEIKTRQVQLTEANQRSTRDRFQERGDLLTLLTETKLAADARIKDTEYEHSRQTELISRGHAQQTDNLKNQYDELLRTQADETAQRLDQQRQEAAFESKLMSRQFATRQTELIREYERKLNDMRSEFKDELVATKSDTERLVRENDRKNKYALQEQARSYEQRIAVLENQHEERLRVIAQNYDEDLNKIRRTNAEILRNKKG
jgi:hypothetical protein